MIELHLYDGNDNPLRRGGYKKVYDRPGVLHSPVYSVEDVRREVRIVGNTIGSINRLCFQTHGHPGLIYLPEGGIDSQSVSILSKVCSLFMAKGAQVWIYGCQVAQGKIGEDFLKLLAQTMLGVGGGLALATNSLTWSMPWYGQWLPPWGDVVAAKVQPGGAVTIVHP
ncbi:MAG: DUF4347 domain-containing protein [Pyrinomonadaceae bacterium]